MRDGRYIRDMYTESCLRAYVSINKTQIRNRTREMQGATAASLLLVGIWTSSNGNASEGTGILKTLFLALIDALKIDRSVLQPFASNVFGLLEFSETAPSDPKESRTISTYFLGDSSIELLWSFDFATSETRAILMNRRGTPDAQSQSHRVLADFLASLHQQRNHIFNPYNLLYIALVHMTTWEAKSRAAKWSRVRVFEQEMGHGRYGDSALTGPRQNRDNNGASATLEELTVAAKHIETLRASLASDERHMDIIDSLLDALEEKQSPQWQQRGDRVIAKRQLALCDRDAAIFSVGVRPLRQRNAASRSALKYMAERARSQSHVVSIA
ncbi:hypothetical protein F4859DRAFT_482239 [Xylaria cf. heliscus]|nr:hypothetical protein F4859DRAFT_482239 [Xylaria cf. heliscus]